MWKVKLVLWIAGKLGIDKEMVKYVFLGVIVIGLFAVYQVKMYNSYQAGITACETKIANQETKVVEKVRYVKQKVDAMPTGDVYDRLQSWTR